MKKELLLPLFFLCFIVTEVISQCPPPGFPAPGNTCPEAPILCQDIDGYCTTINNNNIVQNFPGCPANVLNNDEWFAFFAGTPTIILEIVPTNCQGTGGGVGLQAGMYDGCNGNVMDTQCNCSAVPFTLQSNNFVVGEVYWVVIDGCAGDICDYQVNVLAGSTVPTPPAPPGPVTGLINVCPGANQPYFLDPVMGATEYTWTIVPPIGTISPNDNMATVNFTLPGTAQLCVTVANPCIGNPTPSCITINSTLIEPTDEEAELCLGQSTMCAGQVFFTPGLFPVTQTSYLGCDSIINCLITPIPPITNNLGQVDICAPGAYEICGTFFNQSGIYTEVCESYQGCDSTVIVDLAMMEPIANIAEPVPELGCGANATIVLDGTGSSFNLVPDGNTLYNWTGPGIVGPNDDVTIIVDQPGFYCLELTHERNGVSCTDTYCVDVFADTEVPDPPLLDGETDICDGQSATYTVTPVGSINVTGYTWTTPGGEPFTNDDDVTITVDWTGSAGGDLCVTADNDCGPSAPTCLTIVIGTSPEDPILSGPEDVCDGDIFTYEITNPTPDATCTWTVPVGASFNDNGFNIEVNFGGASSGDVCVTCMNSCGTSAETCLTVNVTNIPDAPGFESGPAEVCDGNIATFCVTADPNATDYTWDTPQGNFPNVGNCIDLDWTGITSGDVCVTANNDCGISQQTCMAVTVNDSPTATISGGGDFCQGSGDTIQLTVTLTGVAPWNLTYTDGTNSFTENDIQSSPFIINAITAGSYAPTDVTDASICSGVVSGQADVVENELPTVQLSGSGDICEGSGETVELTIDLTGASDWLVDWTVDGAPQAQLSISSSPYTLEIGQSQAGDVEITGVTDANNCTNTGDGNIINVVVNEAPSVSGVMTTCNMTNTNYVLTFEISGGDSTTYSVTSNVLGFGGTLSGSAPFIFTSDPILNGDGYSFVVTDANDCDPITVEDDIVICDCTTAVGEMDLNTIEQCGNDPVNANYDNSNEVLDGDDILEFILHEGNSVNIVNQIATNNTPSFGFQPGMSYGTQYYISAIVGNDNGSGVVNQNDPCLAVAQGTPVVFYEIPSAFMIGDEAICEGESTGLSVELTGIGPWNLLYMANADTIQVNGINSNPFNLNVTPSSTTVYNLIGITDDNCPGEIDGSITVTVNTEVQVNNLSTDCNATSTGYVLSFEITGGDPNTYTVTGVNGSISASAPYIFTSDEIPTNTGYDIIVDDINSCNPQSIMDDIVVCNCVTDVGEMDSNPIDECSDGPIMAIYDDTNQATDADDIVQFVLHTGNVNLGTIIQTNNTEPSFSFDGNTMSYGTTYYISAIVGNDDGTGNVDSNEPCFLIAPGTPVTFFEVPTGSLSGDIEICEGGDTDLIIELTGDSPWTVVINGQSISGIVSTPFIYNVNPNTSTTYILENVDDNNCPGSVVGDATVVVNDAPTVNNLSVECNPTNTAYTVSFEIEGGDNTCYTVNGSPGTLTGNVFVSDEIPTGSGYTFQVDDCKDCGPVVVTEPMIICDCESFAGDMTGLDQTICGIGPAIAEYGGGEILDADDVLCYILHEGDPSAPLANNPTEPSFQFQPANMNYGQTYFICASVGNDNGNGCVSLSDPCRHVSQICTEVIYYEIPSIALTGDATICEGENVDLTVSFTGGTAPYTFIYEDAFTASQEELTTDENPFTFSVTPSGSTVYNLISLDDQNCMGTAAGSFPVTVNPAPTISNLTTLCNDLATAYTVSFTINSSSPNITVNPPGSGTVSPSAPYIFTSNEIDALDGFAFEIDNENGCGPVFVTDGPPVCQCITEAGTMEANVIAACETESISSLHNGDEMLDPNDVLGFMLHSQPDGDYSNALATNTIPTFAFDGASMLTGTTYYICPVAGNDTGSGSPDPTDDCFIVGECTPVFWYPLPTATITGTTTICEGETANVSFNLTGVSPHVIDYLENNTPQTLTVWGDDTTVVWSPSANVQIELVGITDNLTGCTNSASGIITINVNTPVNSGVAGDPIAICEGEDQNIDLANLLTGEDMGGQWSDEFGIPVGPIFNPFGRPPGTYKFTYTVFAQAPCPDQATTVCVIINPLPVADAGDPQELTCNVMVANLGGPNTSSGDFTFQWQGDGVTDPNVAVTNTTLPGMYTLTVIDNQTGCSASDQVEITLDQSAPNPSITFSDLSCFGANDGFITLDPITGGSPPYECSINGGPFSNISTFTNLNAGQYLIICRDSKGCEVEIPIDITQPDELQVDLDGDFENDDNFINLGDSVRIIVQVNLPFDSLDAIIWTPNEAIPCDTCQTFYVTPDGQMNISITVQEGQCTDTDDLTIFVRKNRPVYVPNAFSPNGDNNNDKLIIYGGNSVERIKTFLVFNRWGETVWEYSDFQPNDPASGWDGYHRGQELNPGVFAWFAEIEFIDGVVEVYEGDVVLIK